MVACDPVVSLFWVDMVLKTSFEREIMQDATSNDQRQSYASKKAKLCLKRQNYVSLHSKCGTSRTFDSFGCQNFNNGEITSFNSDPNVKHS